MTARRRSPSRRRATRARHAAGAVLVATATVLAVATTTRTGTGTAACHARGLLPDPACTPGALDPTVSQASIGRTICVPGYTATVRNVPDSVRAQVVAAYGNPARPFEVDHLVSLELGGTNAPLNLWPEAGTVPQFPGKDQLEDRLHRLVCAGTVPLALAQAAIAADWTAAYRTYIGPLPPGAH